MCCDAASKFSTSDKCSVIRSTTEATAESTHSGASTPLSRTGLLNPTPVDDEELDDEVTCTVVSTVEDTAGSVLV